MMEDDLDDLEEFAERTRHSVNNPSRSLRPASRAGLRKMFARGRESVRTISTSLAEAQERSLARRKVSITLPKLKCLEGFKDKD